jgi:hypothetical protein
MPFDVSLHTPLCPSTPFNTLLHTLQRVMALLHVTLGCDMSLLTPSVRGWHRLVVLGEGEGPHMLAFGVRVKTPTCSLGVRVRVHILVRARARVGEGKGTHASVGEGESMHMHVCEGEVYQRWTGGLVR